MPLRAPRLLLLAAGLLATTFAVSALWIQKRGWQQSARRHAAALEEERQARRRTERLLAAERGARAALLAGDHPGDLAALRLGLLATSSAAEGAQAELPPSALYGLTQAVAARGYPRFPPWGHEWPGGPYDKDIEYARFTPDGSAVITAGDGCDWRRRDVRSGERFAFECPRIWETLTPTADPKVRHCADCQQRVYFEDSPAAVESRALAGQCVAIPAPVADGKYQSLTRAMVGRPNPRAIWAEAIPWPEPEGRSTR